MDLNQAFQDAFDKVTTWIESLVENLPEMISAIIIMVVFFLIARRVRNVVKRLMDRATDHGPVKSLLGNVAYLLVVALGVFLALGVLQLDQAVTSLFAGLGILGLALGFAFKDIAENFIAGILMTFRRPFTDGDLVETNGYFGRVEDIDLRATQIRTPQGELVRIPNGSVYGNPLTNYTDSPTRRMDLSCGVSYGADLDKARTVALEAMRTIPHRDETRDPEFFYKEFGGSSIDFDVRVWLQDPEQTTMLAARSDAVIKLKKAFDDNDIGIPFPIVTLDFSDAGTRQLDEPLKTLKP
ncbi:MAG: mechanosensitive ion channel family protein [Acidimicrobiia bacterium]|nr:mechanosensitive ion channel family protein [Acidimicrobiia bacterium]